MLAVYNALIDLHSKADGHKMDDRQKRCVAMALTEVSPQPKRTDINIFCLINVMLEIFQIYKIAPDSNIVSFLFRYVSNSEYGKKWTMIWINDKTQIKFAYDVYYKDATTKMKELYDIYLPQLKKVADQT